MNIKNIHIIRGIAALIVVIFHSKFILWAGGTEYINNVGLHSITDYALFSLDMLSSCGKQSVIVFFLLSAFVITHTFAKNSSLSLFAIIRVIRIYLPYIASVTISTIVLFYCAKYIIAAACPEREYTTRLVTAFYEISWDTFLKTLIFIPNKEYSGGNFAYWSLLHEAIFYILFPFYYKLSNRFLFVLAIGSFISSFIFHTEFLYFQAYFIVGMVIYKELYMKERFFRINHFVAFGAMIFVYVAINLLIKFHFDYLADASALILYILAMNFLLTSEIKIPALLKRLSDQSYSLYLFHVPTLMLFYTILLNFTGTCVFFNRIPYYSGVIVALLVNIPLYYVFEYQSLSIISRVKKSWK